ncbi:MAG: methylenetetrahydrofolate reductase [NAD(P)H] [bacterium]|nr:methylenetetrahydrofolate reductase [NAD(P)H] [bacterium]
MKVSEHISKKDRPVISLEFSRPINDKASINLDKALNKLKELHPDYVSVTFGAGGSNHEGSVQLLNKLKNELNFKTVAYIAAVGLSKEKLTEVLNQFNELGIKTVFAVRGDAPTWDENYKPHPEAFNYASDLINFINEKYDFCIGAAGYPESHIESEHIDNDIKVLKKKIKNGAEYIVAQYFYDNQYFFDFVEKCRNAGITVPIIPGVMPIYTEKLMNNLAKVCGTKITEKIKNDIAALPQDDKKAIAEYGTNLALEQCKDLLRRGVDGLHFYTMNRANTVVSVINKLKEEGLL